MRAARGLLAATVAGLAGAFATVAVLANAPNPPRGDKELGEYLSSMCVGCHQLSGRASGGIPAIVAWPDEQFVAVIQSYKDGTRDNETMRTISHRLSQEEIEALAAFFGALPPPKTP